MLVESYVLLCFGQTKSALPSLFLGWGLGLPSWATECKFAVDFALMEPFTDNGRAGTTGRCRSGLVATRARDFGSGDD